MDAVLDDVRDLITTDATDDESAAATSPLSAPDLRLLISRLTVRSDRIKSEVKSYIETHRDEFSHLFTAASRSLSSLSLLHRSLSLLLPSLSPPSSPYSSIRLVADDITANTALLREKRELLASVKRVLGFSERLEALRRDLESGRFVEAAATWREVETGLGGDVAERDCEPVVYALLRKECSRCFDEGQGF